MDDSRAGQVVAGMAIRDWTRIGQARNWIVGRGYLGNDHVLASVYAPGAPGEDLLTDGQRAQAAAAVMQGSQAYAAVAARVVRGGSADGLAVARLLSMNGLDTVLVENFAADEPQPMSAAISFGPGFTPWPDDRLAALAGAIAWQQTPFLEAGLGHFNINPDTLVRTASGHCYCAAALPPENSLITLCRRDAVVNPNIYCAPELSDLTFEQISLSADVYSCSLILFQLATGTLPATWDERLDPHTDAALVAALAGRNDDLVAAIVAGLNPIAERRPADLRAWSADVCACIGGPPQSGLIAPWVNSGDESPRRVSLDKGKVDPSAEHRDAPEAEPAEAGEAVVARSGMGFRRELWAENGRQEQSGVRKPVLYWFVLGTISVLLLAVIGFFVWQEAVRPVTSSAPAAAESVALADPLPAPVLTRWANGLTVNLAPFVGQFCTQQEQQCLYSPMTISSDASSGKLRMKIDGMPGEYQFDIDRSRPFDFQPVLYLVARPRVGPQGFPSVSFAQRPYTVEIRASDLGRDGTTRYGDRLEVRWSDSMNTEIYVRCRDNCAPPPALLDQPATAPSPVPAREPAHEMPPDMVRGSSPTQGRGPFSGSPNSLPDDEGPK